MEKTKINVRKILVFRFGGVGDYVCLLPFLEDLRKYFPASEITAIIAPSGKELLENSGLLSSCIVSNRIYMQGSESLLTCEAISDFRNIRRQLQPPYDLYVDLTNKYSLCGVFKPMLFKIISSPSLSIGLDYKKRGFFLDMKVPEDRYEIKHIIQRYCDILKALGVKSEFHLPELQLPAETAEKAQRFFSPWGNTIKIGLHPGANRKFINQRAWPVERFAKLADMIKGSMDCEIFATGSSDEQELLTKLCSLSNAKIIIVPQCPGIIEFSAYLENLNFYVSNDTGAMHLAVAMKVPTIGIFGHADFEVYGTYPSHIPFVGITIEKGEKHGPSPNFEDPRGLLEISVDNVFSSFLKLKEKTLASKKNTASL